jgi:ABC-type transport system involved in cytochrome c biogenesis ATPase subunit
MRWNGVTTRRGRLAAVAIIVLGLTLATVGRPATAQDTDSSKPKADRPPRGMLVYTEYSDVTVPVGETVRMDLTVENTGCREENVSVRLTSVPKGWRAAIKGGEFEVGGVPVTPDKPRALTFTAEPDRGLERSAYTFQIEAATADRAISGAQTVVIRTREKKAAEDAQLEITTSYPILRGPTDSSFEFSLEVNNKSDVDRVVNVAAQAPDDWDVSIKPSYESKQISSLRIRPGSSQTVALALKPPRDAKAGSYPVVFRASTGGAGKTTTILMLLGLSQPTAGHARVCGLDPAREPVAVKRLVGYLPENVGFYQDMTAFDNLLYVARLNGLRDQSARPHIEEALRRVGLADEARKRVGAYSRGMRQRLGIAEVLIKEPRGVFLDEPTAGLDPDGTQKIP